MTTILSCERFKMKLIKTNSTCSDIVVNPTGEAPSKVELDRINKDLSDPHFMNLGYRVFIFSRGCRGVMLTDIDNIRALFFQVGYECLFEEKEKVSIVFGEDTMTPTGTYVKTQLMGLKKIAE